MVSLLKFCCRKNGGSHTRNLNEKLLGVCENHKNKKNVSINKGRITNINSIITTTKKTSKINETNTGLKLCLNDNDLILDFLKF